MEHFKVKTMFRDTYIWFYLNKKKLFICKNSGTNNHIYSSKTNLWWFLHSKDCLDEVSTLPVSQINKWLKNSQFLCTVLTARQCGMTGDTNPSLLPVHVCQLTLQTAAGCTEHLRTNTRPSDSCKPWGNVLMHWKDERCKCVPSGLASICPGGCSFQPHVIRCGVRIPAEPASPGSSSSSVFV